MWCPKVDNDESEEFRCRRSERLEAIARGVERRLTQKSIGSAVRKLIPITQWLPGYDLKSSFFADLSAGLTMAVFSIPTGIAHAGICGVEPVYGLYTSIFPTFLYMIFGNSKYNALGPFAILSVLTQSLIEKVQFAASPHNVTHYFNETDGMVFVNITEMYNISTNGLKAVAVEEWPNGWEPIRPIHVATTVMFLSGIFHIILGLFRADFLSCYLSEQVMSGFVVGGGVHVFFSQIGEALGIRLPARSGAGSLFYRVEDLYEHFHEIQTPTAIITIVSIIFLTFCHSVLEPWLNSVFVFPVPFELLLVIVGITATNYADLSNRHSVAVVGNIPTDFPPPALPRIELIPSIFVTTIGITIVTVAIHLTVVKIVESRYHESINSCQELYALGFVSVLSSAFPVFPVTSIFARTLIGNADRNTTQLTICFSSLALLTVVLYIGPALEYLPKCVLAAIILYSLTASFNKLGEIRKLWPVFKTDLVIFVVTVLLTVCYDLAKGLIASVTFAVLTTVIRNQCSSWHILTHDADINEFREVPKKQLGEVESHACVFRFDGALIFTSVQKFSNAVRKAVKRWERRDENAVQIDDSGFRWRIRPQSQKRSRSDTDLGAPTVLIVDCSGFPYIDYLGLCTLKRTFSDFSAAGVVVRFAAPKAVLLRMFAETDFYEAVPRDKVFASVKLAVESEEMIPNRSALSLNVELLATAETLAEDEDAFGHEKAY